MEQQTPARPSTKKLDIGILAFAVLCAFAVQCLFYLGFHYPSTNTQLIGSLLILLYFAICGVLGILVFLRFIRGRARESLFLIAAAAVLISLRWIAPPTYPYISRSIDWVRFQKDRQFYDRAVSSADPSEVHIFKWGESDSAGMRKFSYLIFDKDDRMWSSSKQRINLLKQATLHSEPIGGQVDTSMLFDKRCHTFGRQMSDGYRLVGVDCEH